MATKTSGITGKLKLDNSELKAKAAEGIKTLEDYARKATEIVSIKPRAVVNGSGWGTPGQAMFSQITPQIRQYNEAAKASARIMGQNITTNGVATASFNKLGRSGYSGGMGVLALSEAFEDAQYGIRGVLNNIPQAVLAFGGGAGLAGVLSIAAVTASVLSTHLGFTETQLHKSLKATEILTRGMEEETFAARMASDAQVQMNQAHEAFELVSVRSAQAHARIADAIEDEVTLARAAAKASSEQTNAELRLAHARNANYYGKLKEGDFFKPNADFESERRIAKEKLAASMQLSEAEEKAARKRSENSAQEGKEAEDRARSVRLNTQGLLEPGQAEQMEKEMASYKEVRDEIKKAADDARAPGAMDHVGDITRIPGAMWRALSPGAKVKNDIETAGSAETFAGEGDFKRAKSKSQIEAMLKAADYKIPPEILNQENEVARFMKILVKEHEAIEAYEQKNTSLGGKVTAHKRTQESSGFPDAAAARAAAEAESAKALAHRRDADQDADKAKALAKERQTARDTGKSDDEAADLEMRTEQEKNMRERVKKFTDGIGHAIDGLTGGLIESIRKLRARSKERDIEREKRGIDLSVSEIRNPRSRRRAQRAVELGRRTREIMEEQGISDPREAAGIAAREQRVKDRASGDRTIRGATARGYEGLDAYKSYRDGGLPVKLTDNQKRGDVELNKAKRDLGNRHIKESKNAPASAGTVEGLLGQILTAIQNQKTPAEKHKPLRNG